MMPAVERSPYAPVTLTDREFARLRALVRAETGIALRDSKRALVCARLGRRLRHHGYTTFEEYCTHLEERDPVGDERRCLVDAITTTKTDFYRERHHFDFLRETVLPALARSGAERLRLWSAGCSTGEEPYSLAWTLLGIPHARSGDVRILASDINTSALATAEAGLYPRELLAGVPPAAWKPYVTPVPGETPLVSVNAAARALITFRRINLCQRPWPIRTRFDVIFCRNVMIYFDRVTQSALLQALVEQLVPGGYLFLGHSESLLGAEMRLSYVGRTVYRKPQGHA
jgi:chemotaxis protein methyltransferase CheR